MTVLRILQAARSLIVLGWCQYDNAQDEKGREVATTSPIARKWCMNGAVWAIPLSEDILNNNKRYDALNLLREQVPNGTMAVWQDNPERTKEEVLAAFDRAIAAAKNSYDASELGLHSGEWPITLKIAGELWQKGRPIFADNGVIVFADNGVIVGYQYDGVGESILVYDD